MHFKKLYVGIAALASLLLAASACQTARKPAPLMPAKTAPALKPATGAQTPAPAPAQEPAPAPPSEPTSQKAAEVQSTEPTPAAPAPDRVADLIAKVEKE